MSVPDRVKTGMRGRKQAQRQFVAMIDVNARIPEKHPIREIKRLSDEVFGRLSPRFEAMYSELGRPSIPPERLLGARLLMALFSVPSERAFCERLRYDLLFQWFLDLELSRRDPSRRAPSAKTSNGCSNTKPPTSFLPKWSAYCGKE